MKLYSLCSRKIVRHAVEHALAHAGAAARRAAFLPLASGPRILATVKDTVLYLLHPY